MIDALDDIGAALKDARPESLVNLYHDLRLEIGYLNDRDAASATASLRVVSECVREGFLDTKTRVNSRADHST